MRPVKPSSPTKPVAPMNAVNSTNPFHKPYPLVLALLLALVASLALPGTARAQVYDDGYTLNAGDSVRIHVYGEEDLSFDQLLIGQNGRISYPFLGELTVAGKTASQLQAELTAGLKPDYLVDPRISVSVVKYRSFFVNGEVQPPRRGRLPARPHPAQGHLAGGGLYRAGQQEGRPGDLRQ